jgi:uncharacterized protein
MATIQSNISPTQNSYDAELARDNSSYAAFQDTRLVLPQTPDIKPNALLSFVHDSFRALVLNPQFSCVGAKSAVQTGSYRIGHYAELGSPGATAGLAQDLNTFIQEQPAMDAEFSTLVATFTGPVGTNEEEFERLLWNQLQNLHELDFRHHRWDPTVSDDPADPHFSFSFAEHSFFVVGLHPASSRFTRRFAWPTLVFNIHSQFEALRASGRFERMQDVIRKRETNLQGDINVNLANFGEASEARQYSGRPVESDWRCPFTVHRA